MISWPCKRLSLVLYRCTSEMQVGFPSYFFFVGMVSVLSGIMWGACWGGCLDARPGVSVIGSRVLNLGHFAGHRSVDSGLMCCCVGTNI